MSCWPPCSEWCECVNDTCRPTTATINAVRFRTPDGRLLQAQNGGGGLMVGASVATPMTAETFLFMAPAASPLSSGAPISLGVCSGTWEPSGFLVRADHNVKVFPGSHKSPGLVSYEIGGAGARIFVSGPFQMGYPAYRGDDPAEWTFDIVKLVGGAAVSPGTPINSGDSVTLRINSNWGNTFFFRVIGGQSGAEVHGDGTVVGQPGTMFTVEFNEVRSGLGWRPSVIKCRSCAVVRVHVTRASTGHAISNATVVALVPNHPFTGTTLPDGFTTPVDSAGRDCIPAGNVPLQASADQHQTKTVTATVPDSRSVRVSIQLDCTQVSGKVVDDNGIAVPGVAVYLLDQAGNFIGDENGDPYYVTTAADGSFVFNCVAHTYVSVWTPADPSHEQHRVVPPEGWINVTIVIHATCGDLIGTVTDADTGQPIQGGAVSLAGVVGSTTTDANGAFKLTCVRPAGTRAVFASAPGYSPALAVGTVPTMGNSSPVNIKLHRFVAMAFQIKLDWGPQPLDLDSHLSGPDGAGGRFHLCWSNRGGLPSILGSAPPFVDLDTDAVSGFGPETITIQRSPAAATGTFIAGDYHYWVHDYSDRYGFGATFVGSGATVAVCILDAAGNLTQVGYYAVANATGTEDDLWHVVDFTIDASGNIVLHAVQTFQAGDFTTLL